MQNVWSVEHVINRTSQQSQFHAFKRRCNFAVSQFGFLANSFWAFNSENAEISYQIESIEEHFVSSVVISRTKPTLVQMENNFPDNFTRNRGLSSAIFLLSIRFLCWRRPKRRTSKSDRINHILTQHPRNHNLNDLQPRIIIVSRINFDGITRPSRALRGSSQLSMRRNLFAHKSGK